MSGPKHLPLLGWSKRELLDELWRHEQAVKNLQKEFDRRGERDEQRHGFAVPFQPSPGVIETHYAHYPTAVAAYDAARKQWPDDESAPYRVHPVYLGKDDL